MNVQGRERGADDEPMFDLPPVVTGAVMVLVGIHLLRGFLSPRADEMVLALFAFIPDRFVLEAGEPAYPGGWGAMAWTFLSHAGLHGSWLHLMFNSVMLAAVGRSVAGRIGEWRFLVLALASAAGGGAAHLVADWGSGLPMIGASGAVFGVMGAALRFVFVPAWQPLPSAIAALGLPRVRSFVSALVLMNVILVVVGSAPFGGDGGDVAWAAHLGGFLVGYFGFAIFDRPQRSMS